MEYTSKKFVLTTESDASWFLFYKILIKNYEII